MLTGMLSQSEIRMLWTSPCCSVFSQTAAKRPASQSSIMDISQAERQMMQTEQADLQPDEVALKAYMGDALFWASSQQERQRYSQARDQGETVNQAFWRLEWQRAGLTEAVMQTWSDRKREFWWIYVSKIEQTSLLKADYCMAAAHIMQGQHW